MTCVAGSIAGSPTDASYTVTDSMVPVSRSASCSALWATCVRPSFIFVIFAFQSCGHSQSLVDTYVVTHDGDDCRAVGFLPIAMPFNDRFGEIRNRFGDPTSVVARAVRPLLGGRGWVFRTIVNTDSGQVEHRVRQLTC